MEAVQLALYGRRARTFKRSRASYSDYLADRVHRNGHRQKRAQVSVRFRRALSGYLCRFELVRSWEVTASGAKEHLQVFRDGLIDEALAEHWDDEIDAFLPASIAHLFFFDGEQIKELAEGGNAGEIIGTAMASLLGIEAFDRLDTDLKNFERKKQAELPRSELQVRSEILLEEIGRLDEQQAETLAEEAKARNELGRLEKIVQGLEQQYRASGGSLYEKSLEVQRSLSESKSRKQQCESALRDLVSGILPFALIPKLLESACVQVREDLAIQRQRLLIGELQDRDKQVLEHLANAGIPLAVRKHLSKQFQTDVERRQRKAKQSILLGESNTLDGALNEVASQIDSVRERGALLLAEVAILDGQILELEAELGRVPSEESIGPIVRSLSAAKGALSEQIAVVDSLRERCRTVQRLKEQGESNLERIDTERLSEQKVEDGMVRMLRHSRKVRDTVVRLRQAMIHRHSHAIETLMSESLRQLLQKQDLVSAVRVDPETFEPCLIRKNGVISSDQMSAGERQLLATSILWGLARASGRPVPTIIDTPLGRLDSKHRSRLMTKYFPYVSHQVLLLSTDEEIRGDSYAALKPFVSHAYSLVYDPSKGSTSVVKGYFTS